VKYYEDETKAVGFGYHVTEEDLHRGTRSPKIPRFDFASSKPGQTHPNNNHVRAK